MRRATEVLHNRIAVVFDFDSTLGEDSVDLLLTQLGVDPSQFRRERVGPLDSKGWDHALALVKSLVDLSNSMGGVITEHLLRDLGRHVPLYPGVEKMFDRVRRAAGAIVNDVEVEFYLLTAGFAEVPSSTAIAGEFKAIWGSAGHYADDGRLAFPKRIITHPEKVRYLLQMAKGMSADAGDAPADVFRELPQDKWHVPLDQVVYLGDGASDLPAFELVHDRGGIGIGVYGPGQTASEWSKKREIYPDRRVQNLAEADFLEGSELLRALLLAVESIAKLIALRQLAQGE